MNASVGGDALAASFAIGGADGSFETGLNGTVTEGDVGLVGRLGVLTPTQGAQALLMTTEPDQGSQPADADRASLRIEGFAIPAGTGSLRLDYSFLTNEPIPSRTNDRFKVTLVLVTAGGEKALLAQDTFDRFQPAPWTGYAEQTGFRKLVTDVSAYAGGADSFTLELRVEDVGDGRADSAVLVDNLIFAAAGEPVARVAEPYLHVPLGSEVVLDGSGSGDDGSIAEYRWDLGNGWYAIGPVIPYTYTDEGFYQTRLQVTDDEGNISTQDVTVIVGDLNHGPTIVSTPVIAAAQNVEYRYQVRVEDPELVYGDAMSYALTEGPAGMAIDPASGRITWTPTAANPRKSNVTVRVEDSEGLFDTQSFSVTIGPEIYVVAAQDDGWLYFSRSFGDGTWTTPEVIDDVGYNTRGVAIADFDGDGDFDFISGSDSTDPTLSLYFYEREGTRFLAPVPIGTVGTTPFPAGDWLEDMAAEDFDNDGAMDVAVNGDSAYTWLFMNRGRLEFSEAVFLTTDFETGTAEGWVASVGGTTVSVDTTEVNPASGSTASLRIAATANNNRLSAGLNTSNWSLGAGSTLQLAYKVPTGVPVGFYVYISNKGWLYLGGSPTVIPDNSTRNDVIDLIDDGTWRVLDLDLYYAVKKIWPDAGSITQALFWTNYNAQTGQAFWIDDFEVTRREYVSGFDLRRLSSTGGNGRGLDAGDFDGDGDLDLVRARYGDGLLYTYRNDGVGGFTASTSAVADPGADPYGVLLKDFDKDGAVDIIANYGSTGDSYFFKGNRSGSFQAGVGIPSLNPHNYASLGAYDFDNDGDEDVVAANYSSRQMLYYPANGNATFGTAVLIGNTASNDLAIAAPAGRVIGQPFAEVDADTESIDVGGTVNFDASASFDDGVIGLYRWDFGDGTTATGATVSHTFTREGEYKVIVSVVDNEAKTDRRSIRIKVNGDPPVAVAGSYLFDERYALNGKWHGFLNGNGSTDDSAIVVYEWDFDAANGVALEPLGPTPRTDYSVPGTYTVTLRVTDTVGNTHTATGTVVVTANAAPGADLVGPTVLDETDASLGMWTGWYDASASSDDFGIATYSVVWNDGTASDLAPMADDFDDDNYTGWTVNGGSWSVVGGVLQQTDLSETWRWLQDLTRSYRDFVLELDFRGIEGPSDGYVGIVFRNANSAGSTNSFLLYSRASWDFWRFYDWQAGTVLADGGSGWDHDIWYHLKLVVVGGNMRLWVTPEGGTESVAPALEVTNVAHPEGGIGLLSHGLHAYFDNVKVTPLDTVWTRYAAGLHDLVHEYASAGGRTVELRVRDHAGQQDQKALTVSVEAGAVPVADTGGPYVLGEWDAWDGRWDFIGDFTASSDDNAIERFRIDFGNGTGYTTSAASGAATGYFMTGTDLYGYDVAEASLQRILAIEDNTKIDIVDLATKRVIASNTLNRLQSWNGVSPGDGVFFKVKASKPVAAYLTNFGSHSAFMPSLDGTPVGKEFVIHRAGNQGFYVYAYDDAWVRFYNTGGDLAAERFLRAGDYWSTGSPLGDTTYRVVSTGRIAMQTSGLNGYTTVPSENGSPAGRRFYCATYGWQTGAFAVFAYAAANVQVVDLDSGAALYTRAIAAGEMWYQNGVGTRRIRVESDADVELWAGDTEGGSGIVDLGDDISVTTGREGTEFVLHELRDGIVIFSPNEDTAIDIDNGLLTRTLGRDGYLLLSPTDLPPLDVHRITASKPVVIQTLGRANIFNDLGTYLGGVSSRNWYGAVGTYSLQVVAIDNAGQQSAVAATTVRVTQGDPPVPRIVAPPEVDEGSAHGGLWPVHFDATGSTDDSEIIRYEWAFGDGATATGAVVDHEYAAVGEYDVTLTTTDRAGQKSSASWTIKVTRGAPPVADTGGPYTFGEASASHGVWAAPIDATGSTDDRAIYDFLWTLEPISVDDFSDTALDDEIWQYSRVALDAGVARVTPSGGWGSAYLVAKQPYRRASGTSFMGTVKATSTGEYLMWGLKDLGPSTSYANFAYAIYFDNGQLRIYEYGGHWANVGAYVRNQDYEVRIDVKQPAGAVYYIRALGAADWTRLYESANYSDPLLRLGLTAYAGTFEVKGFAVQQTDERPITSMSFAKPGIYDLTLRVRDNALQEAYETTTITMADGAPPVANAGGPYQAEVGSLVTFDGSGSSDDVALQTYHWVFGDSTGGPADLPYTGKGARPQHFYRAAGTYAVALEVTDNTGKSATDTAQVTVVTGAPPLADAGGPYVGGANGPPVYFDGTASTDDFGVVEYRWDFDATVDRNGDGDLTNDIDAVGPRPFHVFGGTGNFFSEAFDGTTLDAGRWIASAGVFTQDGWAIVSGVHGWDSRYLFSQETFGRANSTFQGQVRPPNAHAMWGLKNTGTDYSYTQMPHAIYFATGALHIYEMGSHRAHVGYYTPGELYDVRIDLKASAGATYYIKPVTATQWTQIFDSANRSDSPLRLGATVYNEAFGFDNFAALGPDHHTVTLTVEDGAGQTASDTLSVTAPSNLPPDVVTVPWVASDLLTPHETYNGKAIRLKGIVRDADSIEFEWDFGDGTKSGRLPVTNPYDLSVSHTYPDSPDKTPFTATLTVWDSLGQSGQDIYRVIVKRKNLTVETNVAIDEGLWYLHQRQTRTTSDGYPSGWWTTSTHGGYYASPTASALQAFQINGHFEHGDNSTNPYAETVARGLKYLFTRIGTNAITTQTFGEPDTNGNGIGITVTEGHPIYQGGPVMDAIASSRTPLARSVTGGDQVKRRRYCDILTDMSDQFAWGQYDSDYYGGGWRYNWQDFPDNSAAQWGAIGLQAAEDIFGIPLPPWVKRLNDIWVSYSSDGTGFGYTGPGNGRATTPSGMVQLAFDDKGVLDPRWQGAEAFIASQWSRTDGDSVIYQWPCGVPSAGTETCRDYYAMYAFTKAMRLAVPEQVINLNWTGLDWFEDPDNGIARVLIGDQLPTGRFQGSNWESWDMRSAWGVIMLSRTLFVERPVADAGDDSVWAIDVPFTFDGSNSYHPDPFRSIVRYEWDVNGDGAFDYVSSTPTVQHTFTDPVADLPKTYTATLRVTDNNIPPLTATDTVQVTLSIPPRPPIADAGGPYVCTRGVPCRLDGTGSYDLDEPFDRVTAYGWELDFAEFPRDFDDALGPQPTYAFPALGTFDVGLTVWDNGFLNDLDGDGEVDEDEKKTGQDFTRVLVVANQAPSAVVNGPFTIVEGGSVILDGSGSSDPNGDALTYLWDLDGDSEHDDATGATVSFTRGDDGIYAIGLKVSDTLLEDTAGTSVTVTNIAPAVNAGADKSVAEGSAFSGSGSFTDPGADTWTATVDYGDGSGVQLLALNADKTFALGHGYADNGAYTVTVTVSDDDGGVGTDSLTVTVSNLAPVVDAGPDATIDEGSAFSASGSFTDPGADAWTATVDYGEGGGVQMLALNVDKTFALGHTYTDDGAYTVTVTVRDGDGGVGADTLRVTVADLAPTARVSGDTSRVEGQRGTYDASVSTSSPDALAGYEWDWSYDGSAFAPSGDTGPSASHTWADNGTYTVAVRVTDDDGSTDVATLVVTVANLAPVVEAGPDRSTAPGASVSLAPATFTDAGTADTHAASIDWGDSTVDVGSLTQGAGSGSVAGSHSYAVAGTYTVVVTVTDDEGASSQDSLKVQVTTGNLAPVANPGGPYTVAEGGLLTLDASASSDPDNGPDPLGYAWDLNNDGVFGDASGKTVDMLVGDDAVLTVALQVSDGQLTGSAATTVTVRNVAPAVNAGADQGIDEGSTFAGSGSFTDPGADTWGATVDYGDGSGVQPLTLNADKTFNLGHAYADNGSYSVTVTVSDDDGGVGSDGVVVNVNDRAPTARLTGPASLDEGQTGTYDASGSTSSPDAIAGYAWDWSYDGSAFVPSGATGPSASHTWADNGTYTVAVRVTDEDGSTDIATLAVTVANLTPVVEAGPDPTVTLGASVSLAPATFTDAGTEDTHTASIAWGDGTVAAGTVSESNGSGSVSASHSYASAGTYTVSVSVTDDEGAAGSDTFTVRVEPTAPVQTVFDLRAAVKSGKVGLSWGTVAGAGSYNIYRATVAGGPYERLVAGHTCLADPCVYLDAAVTNGRTYRYVVTSVSGGLESLYSNAASATPTGRQR